MTFKYRTIAFVFQLFAFRWIIYHEWQSNSSNCINNI